jgi:hypothetical protein
MGSDRLGFVGSPVARQSLDLVLRRLPSIYVTMREGGALPYMASAPDQGMDGIGFLIPEIFPNGRRSHS